MTYQEFIDNILAGVSNYYGKDAEVTITTVTKNNDISMDAMHIVFREKDNVICPSIYLQPLYEEYLEGDEDIEEFVDKIILMRKEYEPNDFLKQFANNLTKWNEVQEYVYPVLVSKTDNGEYLSNYVTNTFLDLAVIYEVRLEMDEENYGSTKITHGLLNLYGVSKERLHEKALENMKKDDYQLESLFDKLQGLMNMENIELEKETTDIEPCSLYILTNRKNSYGAAALLDKELVHKCFRDTKGIIIPSSLHEVLFMPLESSVSINNINSMICEINQTVVARNDRLSNHAYLWTGDEIQIAA